MTDESQQYIGPLPQTGEAAIHLSAYGTDCLQRCVAQVLLDIPMHVLLGVQVRGISREGVVNLFVPMLPKRRSVMVQPVFVF
jgi:hypothetical protein